MDFAQIPIVHNAAENRFETLIDGKRGELNYLQNGDEFVITHVGVHPSLRGQGIAGKITEAALKYARENALRVVPLCSYAAVYIRRNPQYASLLKEPPESTKNAF